MCIIYTNLNGPKSIDDREWANFKKALTIYYSEGGPIGKAFAQVEPGLIDRYYRRKKKYPEEIEEIDAEAQAAAHELRSSAEVAFDSELFCKTIELQRRAVRVLDAGLTALEKIVTSEPWEVVDRETGEVKVAPVYPRDVIQAIRALHRLARDGVYAGLRSPGVSTGKEKKGNVASPIPLLPVPTDFSKVEANLPDGTKATYIIERDGNVVVRDDDEAVEQGE